jgi:hypothetical protein
VTDIHIDARSPMGASGIRADTLSRVFEEIASRTARQLASKVVAINLPMFDLARAGLPNSSVWMGDLRVGAGSDGLTLSGRPFLTLNGVPQR